MLDERAITAHVRSMTRIAQLSSRAVLAIDGPDRVGFLQGLVSNDVTRAAPDRAVWAALLTPQGKWLADFFIIAEAERLLLDVEAASAGMIATRLGRFRLRSKVTIAPTPLVVHAAWGETAPVVAALVVADPRLEAAGWRVLAAAPLPTDAGADDYDAHRIRLGLPDGGRDLEADKTLLLEAGFDELGGISWDKGCYMGQELTARTRYRGLVRRRLVPVVADGLLPEPGTVIVAGDEEVGELRSRAGSRGLAMLRRAALGSELRADGRVVRVELPGWIRLGDTA
jgi:folate-binding protein YgfZ